MSIFINYDNQSIFKKKSELCVNKYFFFKVLFEFAVRFGDKKLKEVSQSINTVVATTFKMMGITNDQLTEVCIVLIHSGDNCIVYLAMTASIGDLMVINKVY